MKKITILFVLTVLTVLSTSAQTFVLWGTNTPVADLNSSAANDTICEGDAVVFTATVDAGSTYEFIVDGATVQGPSGSNNYVPPAWTPNDYEVVVELDNGSCTARDTIDFVVLALPTPTLASDAPGNTACDGDLITFTAGGGATYSFMINGLSVQSGASNTYATSALVDGDIVTVEVGNGSCSDISGGLTMTINALPVATLVSDAPGNEVCDGSTVTFTATGGVQYEFFVNGTSVQGPAASDTYITSTLVDGDAMTAEVTNANACLDISAPVNMIINPLPTVTSVTGNPTAECVGSMAPVDITGLTGTSPWTLEIYDDVAGNPGSLYYAVPGTIVTPNTTITVPIPADGFSTMHLRIIDGKLCRNF